MWTLGTTISRFAPTSALTRHRVQTAPSRRGRFAFRLARAGEQGEGPMFPSRFDYVAASTLEEAVAAKAADGEEARILAGGQSLLPMMKIRLASPAKLIDIN